MAKRKRRNRPRRKFTLKTDEPDPPVLNSQGEPVAKPHLRATLLEIVENQLRDGDPPETQETYQRLRDEGYSDLEARELIGAVVASEIHDIMKSEQPFDNERYVAALRRLPTMP